MKLAGSVYCYCGSSRAMLSRLSIAFTLVLSVALLPQAALAVTLSATMKSLVAKYQILPTHPNEDLVGALLNNPMVDQFIESPSQGFEAALNQLQLKPIERTILLKQYYLGEIFKQAVREFTDAGLLHGFLTLGFIPDVALRPISTLSDIRTFYEIIGLLVQNTDPNIQFIAMELLRLEGARYPSTDSFARGLANFAAVSASNATLFDQILMRYEALYRTQAQWLAQPTQGLRRRAIVLGFASELASDVYNPGFGHPAQRAIIVRNLLAQVNRRGPSDSAEKTAVRRNLINAIAATAAVAGDEEAWNFTARILSASTHGPDLLAALWLFDAHEPRVYAAVHQLIERLQPLSQDPAMADVIDFALRVLLNAGDSKEPALQAQLKGYLPGLFNHGNPLVRKASVSALRRPLLDAATAHDQLVQFLADPDARVRGDALGYVSMGLPRQLAATYFDTLQKMAQSDPDQNIREFALEVREELISRIQRAASSATCKDKLTN